MKRTTRTTPRWRLALGVTACAAMLAIGPDTMLAAPRDHIDRSQREKEAEPVDTAPAPAPSVVDQAVASLVPAPPPEPVAPVEEAAPVEAPVEPVAAPIEAAPAPIEEAPVEVAPVAPDPAPVAEPAVAEAAVPVEAPAAAPVQAAEEVGAAEAAVSAALAPPVAPAEADAVADEAPTSEITADGGTGIVDGSGGDGSAAVAVPSPFEAAGAAQAPSRVARAAGAQEAAEKNGGAKPASSEQKANTADQRNGGGGGSVVDLRNRLLAPEAAAAPTVGGVAAGNGGTANASADGGIVVTGDIITGFNQGNTIGVGGGACGGSVAVDGGNVTTETVLSMDASGGTAIGDVTGGDANLGGADGDDSVVTGIHAAGNGGFVGIGANGGIIVTGEVITGNNTGNTIDVAGCGGGGSGGGSVAIDGGDVTTTTTINLSAAGGTAIGDASGGDDNVALQNGGGAVEAAPEPRPQRGVVGLRNRLLGIETAGAGAGPVGGILAVGNGGTANASADGGIVVTGDIITGFNQGNTITVGGGAPAGGCTGGGSVAIDGGNVTTDTTIDISADGGTAIGDASGGSGNVGLAQGAIAGILAVGNGGTATSTADGGIVMMGNIVTGFNQGNTIEVGNVGCAAPV